MNDKLISKIRKLLELGTSANAHESEAALMKAQEIALREGIDLAMIETFSDDKAEPIEKDEMALGKRFSVCQKFCSWIIQSHFNCSVIYTGSRYYGRKIIFVGKKTNLDIARYINRFLNQEFMRLWHKYRENNSGARTEERGSFLYGCYQGLNEKLTANKKAVETDELGHVSSIAGKSFEETQLKYALMVVSQKDRLAKETAQMFPHLRRGTSRTVLCSSNALESGKIEGRKISLNRALTGNQKSLT